ncbi:MAG: hypothetical protein H6851_09310 [Geminicoccaceae bacterium]|nr:hypothetical protein [Geminicoccaceae bacterium]MCB9943801.1 hypothetical protein [Geminicoccaceae bacterium]
MMTRQIASLLMLTLLVAAGVFHLKYSVVRLNSELTLLDADIEEARWQISTLEADWAYLTRPERLSMLAGQIGMHPASVGRIIQVEQIGRMKQLELARRPIPIILPSGGEAALRFKPVATFNLDADGDE